jgi:hypothetical protein
MYDMQGIEIDRAYNFTEKQIEINLSNKVYLLVGNSLPLQVAAGRVITAVGQLTKKQTNQLNRAAKKGLIQKALGSPFPKAKTVYAPLGYDIYEDRQKNLDTILNHSYSGIFENKDAEHKMINPKLERQLTEDAIGGKIEGLTDEQKAVLTKLYSLNNPGNFVIFAFNYDDGNYAWHSTNYKLVKDDDISIAGYYDKWATKRGNWFVLIAKDGKLISTISYPEYNWVFIKKTAKELKEGKHASQLTFRALELTSMINNKCKHGTNALCVKCATVPLI